MASRSCKHPDIRKFDGIRCCLACGEAVLETKFEGALRPQVGSSSASKPYEYTDLNYQLGQEIRLCILLPGEPQDPLCCELVHVNLDDDPVYDAVSYTWANEDGDASLSSTIHCRGEGFLPITVNCDAVLRQLRRFGSKRRLWIDAICINQSKISERNHQVAFMYSVYSRAQYVRICIVEMPKHYRSRTLSYADLFNRVREDGFSSSLENLRMIWHIISDSIYFSRVWVSEEKGHHQHTHMTHFMIRSFKK